MSEFSEFNVWGMKHPVAKGAYVGAAVFLLSTLFVSLAPPAWAFSFPITEGITIDLGSLPPWIGIIIAGAVYWEAHVAKIHAAQAVATATVAVTEVKGVAVKIDGLLADRDVAKIKEGERKGKLAGEEVAATLAQGQREGRDAERASVAAANPTHVQEPMVADVTEKPK